jgi:hypothetical protein
MFRPSSSLLSIIQNAMKIYQSHKKDSESFPIVVELNDGKHYFTSRAALELRDRLDALLKDTSEKTDVHR